MYATYEDACEASLTCRQVERVLVSHGHKLDGSCPICGGYGCSFFVDVPARAPHGTWWGADVLDWLGY